VTTVPQQLHIVPAHARGSRRAARHRRGAALLSALMTIAVLVSLTALAGKAARESARLTVNSRAMAVARAMAESAILAARVTVKAQLDAAPDSLAEDAVFDALLTPERLSRPLASDSLAEGAFAATLVNVSARLDVNTAGVEGLTSLLRTVAPADVAARIATRLDAHVRGDQLSAPTRASLASRDSLVASLLGRRAAPRVLRPFDSLDEVQQVVGDDARWLASIAEELTVDGDGRVDRRHASRAVRAAASGSLVDRPTRLSIVGRGWQPGTAVTHEIQAVFAVEGRELRLVRWREQSR
jgi:Tfp pilus assembly protein PilX